MNAPNDNTAWKRLRGWWLTPPRPGLQRLIHPWEYRRLVGDHEKCTEMITKSAQVSRLSQP